MQSGYPWNQSKARDCRLRLVWKTGHKQNEQQRIHATQIDNHKYIVRVVRCNHKFAESNGWLVRRVAPGELVGIVKSCTCSVVCSYFAAPAMACWTPPIVFDVSTPFSSTVTVSSPFSITLQASSETYVQTRLASLQLLSNSLTFPHISSEYLRSIDPRNSSDTKTKCMLILTAILIYTVTTMTTVFFSRLQWNNSLFLFGCTKAIIFCVKNNSNRHMQEHIFPDFSLTALKFPDFSRFSRWVVILTNTKSLKSCHVTFRRITQNISSNEPVTE